MPHICGDEPPPQIGYFRQIAYASRMGRHNKKIYKSSRNFGELVESNYKRWFIK